MRQPAMTDSWSQSAQAQQESKSLSMTHDSSYDTISCIQDMPDESTPKVTKIGIAFFFTGCIVFSFLGGFGLNLALNSKKYKEGVAEGPRRRASYGGKVVLEDPVMLATRALGWGTLYAIIGSSAVGLATFYLLKKFSLLDVRDDRQIPR